MDYINVYNRNQLIIMDFESNVSLDFWVRVVDWFVDALPMDNLGFIDSFEIRAQNSLKNNFNQNKIDRHLKYIYKSAN